MTDRCARDDATAQAPLAERIREACVVAALAGYEDAAISGLCHEGAFEVAISAIRRLDLDDLKAAGARPTAPGEGLREATAGLVRRLAASGPPFAGSALAIDAALAAGLVAFAARTTAERGAKTFRRRATALARRAERLADVLGERAEDDAASVTRALGGDAQADRWAAALESVLGLGDEAAQVATLAAELADHASPSIRGDVLVALEIASNAAACAGRLAEENLRSIPDAEPKRRARRRLWRTELLVRRARLALGDPRDLDDSAGPGEIRREDSA
jgi:hypothetical protein